MKKIICFLSFLLLIFSRSHSQERANGFFAGPAISYQIKNHSARDTRIGYLIGYFREYPLSGDAYIQPAIQFVSKGGKDNLPNSSSIVMQVSYMEIPLIMNFRPKFLDRKIIFGFGPSISFGIGAKRFYNPSGNTEKIYFGREIDNIKNIEFAFSGNIGLQITNHIGFNFIMNRGISNTVNYPLETYSVKNLYLGARFSYRLINRVQDY